MVSAVECALALQADTVRLNEGAAEGKRLRYRMGIHLGDVLVEGDDLVGDRGQYRGEARTDGRARRKSAFRAWLTRTCGAGSRRGLQTSAKRR